MKTILNTLGATNLSNGIRAINDFYATDPIAIQKLLEHESFDKNIWECAVGMGHLAETLESQGYNVKCSDIIDRNYPNTEIIDFLNCNTKFDGDILTNPPYQKAQEFVEKALELTDKKVIMFLRLQFLESQSRKELLLNSPLRYVYVFSKRVKCAKDGDFARAQGATAVAYAWFIWDKSYHGEPIVRWL